MTTSARSGDFARGLRIRLSFCGSVDGSIRRETCGSAFWQESAEGVRKTQRESTYSLAERGFLRFFSLREAADLEIRGRTVPLKAFAQPAPIAEVPFTSWQAVVWPSRCAFFTGFSGGGVMGRPIWLDPDCDRRELIWVPLLSVLGACTRRRRSARCWRGPRDSQKGSWRRLTSSRKCTGSP